MKRITATLLLMLSMTPVVFAMKPNVLFIAIDDMNDWTMLFDKDNPIQTPNLIRLAKRGTFFTHAYCVAAACCPSRGAVLSGLRPETTGLYDNGKGDWRAAIDPTQTPFIPQYFARFGYITRGAGKILHGYQSAENCPTFQEFGPGGGNYSKKLEHNLNGYSSENSKLLGRRIYDWGEYDAPRQPDEDTVDYINGMMTSLPVDHPVFLAAGIRRPHLPFYAPPSTFARYPFDKVRLPPMPKDDLSDVPRLGVRMAHREGFVYQTASRQPDDSPGSLKKMVQCYQAAADYADEMVGRLLDQLDATGRSKNTIIVLWSDHGYHLGDKESCVKFTLWEKANHVPFIIGAPGITKPGSVCNRSVSLLDIYPTLVELAGLPPKKGLDGVSLVPLLKNPQADWKHPAVMTMGRGNCAVRTERWRYIQYSDGTEELYDQVNDPWDITNLAKNPEYADVVKEHKKWLPTNEK